MRKIIKNDKGFTLIEIIISLMLSLVVFTSSAGLVATLAGFRDKSLIHNELYESANFIQQMFEREFEKASDVIGIKTEQGDLVSEIPMEFIGFDCIMLKRSHYIIEDNTYKSLLIYKKHHEYKERKPLFIFKGQSLDLSSCLNTDKLMGYESGTNLKLMALKAINNGIYEIRIELTFENSEESYTRNFYVKLQEGQ